VLSVEGLATGRGEFAGWSFPLTAFLSVGAFWPVGRGRSHPSVSGSWTLSF
jgi:hypothetical protein